jgi:VWFA-related protein
VRAKLAVFFALTVVAAAPRAQTPVFRAGAQTVPVYATVRDRDGHLVPALTKSDFAVFDDGRPAVVTTFSNDVIPTTMALLLDMSTSMAGEHLRVRDAALTFVRALLSHDRVRIGTFGDEIALSPWLTSDQAVLSRVLHEEVWPGGNTPLWTAMYAGMASIAAEPGRRVVLALTDGIDTGCPRMIGLAPVPQPMMDVAPQTVASQPSPLPPIRCASLADVDRLSVDAEFMVYAIGMEGPGLGGGLIRLADESGGGHFELQRNDDLASTFTEVADELHHQYALGFTPVSLDGRVHSLEVRLSRSGLTARARKSYVASAR